MGSGGYDTTRRALYASSMGFDYKSKEEIFKSSSMTKEMNPKGLTIRESCDSEEHPNSLAIVIGLDVTGSMGSIPHFLVKNGLPSIMENIIQHGNPDPQVLFLGIGDHQCDRAPLQVGQFESSDPLLDKWLTDVWLESGGGGNGGESYLLAWYFAAYHTVIDCFNKRQEKGILFTIGDEPCLKNIFPQDLERIMGKGEYQKFSHHDLIEKASERYHIYHIHLTETFQGSNPNTISGWKELLDDHLLIANNKEDISDIIANTVIKHSKHYSKEVDELTINKVDLTDEALTDEFLDEEML